MRYLLSVVAIWAALTSTVFVLPAAAADQPTVLITGSNRGIGLEVARVYAERGWNVIATCRKPSEADDLNAIAAANSNLVVEQLDVTSGEQIAALSKKYQDQPIDILINNAAISGERDKQVFGSFDWDLYDFVMNVNVKGPMRTAVAFADNVKASEQKKIINISSTQGSIAETKPGRGNSYFYKSSKSSLNMMTHILSNEMKSAGVIVGLVSPGFVDTNFGGLPTLPGMITPRESGEAVVAVIDDFGMDKSGLMITHKGEVAPW